MSNNLRPNRWAEELILLKSLLPNSLRDCPWWHWIRTTEIDRRHLFLLSFNCLLPIKLQQTNTLSSYIFFLQLERIGIYLVKMCQRVYAKMVTKCFHQSMDQCACDKAGWVMKACLGVALIRVDLIDDAFCWTKLWWISVITSQSCKISFNQKNDENW